MRPFVLVLVLSVGCTQNKTPIYAVGGTVATAGIVVLATTAAKPDCASDLTGFGCELQNSWTYVIGALLLTAGLSALAVAAAIDVPEPEQLRPDVGVNPFLPPAEIPAPASEDPQLRELTMQASLAARVGRCGEVAAIANTVDSLDRGYRIAGFVRDDKIRACLH